MTASVPKLVALCSDQCSLHPDKIGAEVTNALLAARANGAGQPSLMKRASEMLGRPVSHGSMQRHIQHMRELAEDQPDPDAPRPNDLAILDAIIASGFRNSRAWKPTIKDTLDAMKLKVSMTGQSAFEDMLEAMNAALDDADDEEIEAENPEAILSPDERSSAEE